ncbi:MAG: hypothetical protein CMC67_04870 [Flavobacteriaceae bacterium]|nr:hypothetical protein [Flavobacteriaceae bacterium]
MILKKLKNYLIISFVIISIILVLIGRTYFYSSYKYIGKQIHEGGFYLGKILSTSKKNFDKIKDIEYKNLEKFISSNKLSKNGKRFIIYTSQTEKKIESIIAIPLKNCPELNLTPKLVCNYFPTQDVIGVTHDGYPTNKDRGWKILDKHLIDINKKIFNAPFEVIWKGSYETKDSTKWITGLYYPIR